MIILKEIDRLAIDSNGEKDLLSMVYDIDLQIEGEIDFFNRKKIYIEFNEDGEMREFPSLGGNSCTNPYYHIYLGRAIENIIQFDKEKIKSIFSQMISFKDDCLRKINDTTDEFEYSRYNKELDNLSSEYRDLQEKQSRARKEERKEELQKEMNLISEKCAKIKDNHITPCKEEMQKHRTDYYAKVAKLREETSEKIVL